MYLDYEVKIPDSRHGITRKTIRGITYILTSRIFTTQTVYHSLSPYSLINLFTAVLGESLFISNLFFTPILE